MVVMNIAAEVRLNARRKKTNHLNVTLRTSNVTVEMLLPATCSVKIKCAYLKLKVRGLELPKAFPAVIATDCSKSTRFVPGAVEEDCRLKGICTENWPPKVCDEGFRNQAKASLATLTVKRVPATVKAPVLVVNCRSIWLSDRAALRPLIWSTSPVAVRLETWAVRICGADGGRLKRSAGPLGGVRSSP